MNRYTACAGEFVHEKFKLEYQVVHLEYVRNSSIKIEAVCYNRRNSLDKEATFKYATNNLKSTDEQLIISLSIVDCVIKNLDIPKEKLYKLIVRDCKVFYIYEV